MFILSSLFSGPGAVGRCREFLAVSDGGQTVFRPESCSASLTPHHIQLGQQRQDPHWPHLGSSEIGSGGSNSTLILFLLFFPQTTCTHKHMHSHMHICTDVEPPSAPAAPCLAPLCLLLSLPPLTYYSVYAVTLTPNYNLNHPPYFPGLLCLVSPWVFRGFPCAVSLASMPLSVVWSVWHQSFTGWV